MIGLIVIAALFFIGGYCFGRAHALWRSHNKS
jgi:hypothetical protein